VHSLVAKQQSSFFSIGLAFVEESASAETALEGGVYLF